MSEFVYLVGAEEVTRAGHAMEQAAREMNGAATCIADALARHERFLDEWLDHMESVLKAGTPGGGT